MNSKFHIAYNGKNWYTTTPTNKQAMELAKFIWENYNVNVTISHGDHINYKTGKPAYWILEFDRNPLEKKVEPKPQKTGYRILNENGTFFGAGTDRGSWFTLEEARKIKQAGQQIVEHDGMNVLWEVL